MIHLALISRAFRPLLLAALAGLALPATAATPLRSYAIDRNRISVSGLSSGAFMAGQMHVAFSDRLVGAGIVAGGPYGCADGSLAFALQRCMDTALGIPDPAALLGEAKAAAAAGRIARLGGLAGDRIYVFSGTNDETVHPEVVATVPQFYRMVGVAATDLEIVDTMPAGHAFIVESAPNGCGVTRTPFVNDCNYDQAGAILTHIYGPPATPPAARPAGELIEFDQEEFLRDPTVHGLGTSGWLYVPPRCAAGAACGVHVVFHGCKQTAPLVGDAVTRRTGYNRWADALDLIVLYPQAHKTSLNPNSCWDWWGYDDPAYATRAGRQMAATDAMLGRLAGETAPQPARCARFSGTNLMHWQAGRARICDVWFYCAVGSGETLGFAFTGEDLYESPPGNFSTTPCGG